MQYRGFTTFQAAASGGVLTVPFDLPPVNVDGRASWPTGAASAWGSNANETPDGNRRRDGMDLVKQVRGID